ncbi:MAG: DUF2218 domain-containing protein [Mesorhizobium sp.]
MSQPPYALTSHADVRTEMASRYLQQLCKHFAHKIPAEFTSEKGTISFPFGTCALKADGDILALDVSAATEEDLGRMRGVIASHLERFAFRDTPTIAWN